MRAESIQDDVLDAPGETPLARLYEAYSPRAVGLAYLLVGDRDLAQDLAHEAFIRVAGRFAHLRDERFFGPYLRQAVMNLVKNHFRRQRVERLFWERLRPTKQASSPTEEVDAADEMWRLLQLLPVRQRTALVLRFYEDLSEGQTADLMKCSVNSVKALVARGLASLRMQFGREEM